jgi:uridine kinase
MSSSDAVVIYTGLHTLLETQESYRQVVYFKILLSISDNNEMQKIFYEIMPKITRDVEQSNAPYSTSFYIENTEVIETGGQSLDVEILCRFYYEHDWINEF